MFTVFSLILVGLSASGILSHLIAGGMLLNVRN
jgi:hypothetical protein